MVVLQLAKGDLLLAHQALVSLMPMYVYQCEACLFKQEIIRPIDSRDDPIICSCKGEMIRQLTAPTMHTWDQWRKFPNITKEGDGSMSFRNKDEYNVHLKETNTIESSTDAPKKTKLGHKIIAVCK